MSGRSLIWAGVHVCIRAMGWWSKWRSYRWPRCVWLGHGFHFLGCHSDAGRPKLILMSLESNERYPNISKNCLNRLYKPSFSNITGHSWLFGWCFCRTCNRNVLPKGTHVQQVSTSSLLAKAQRNAVLVPWLFCLVVMCFKSAECLSMHSAFPAS